jgi:hypothetical protein
MDEVMMPVLKKFAAGFLAAAALIVVPAAGHAQTTSRDVITLQLENADELAEMQGFRLDGRALSSSSLVGLIGDDAQFTFEAYLEAGVEYLIEGFCDEDCTDIDLTLHNAEGEMVTKDTELDDVPELRFRATETGEHFVSVGMIDCSAEQCFYAVRVLRK